MRLPMFTKLTSRVNRNRPVPVPEPVREDLVTMPLPMPIPMKMKTNTKAKTSKTEKVPPPPPPSPPKSPKQIELWYKCKSCGLMLKDYSALRSHKEEKHNEEFQELRCIVFLERDLRANQSRNLEEKAPSIPNFKAVENKFVYSVPVHKAVSAGCSSGSGPKVGQGTGSSVKFNREAVAVADSGNELDSASSGTTVMSNSAAETVPLPRPHFTLTSPCDQTNPIQLPEEFHLLCQRKSEGENTDSVCHRTERVISLEFEPKLLIGEDSTVKPNCLGGKYLPVPVNPEFLSVEIETDSTPSGDISGVELSLLTTGTGTGSEDTFITSLENGDDLDNSQYMDALIHKSLDGNWLIPYDQMDTGMGNQTNSGPGPVKKNGSHSKLGDLSVDVESGTRAGTGTRVMDEKQNSRFDLDSVTVLNESDCKNMKFVIASLTQVESLNKSKSKSAPVSPGFDGGHNGSTTPQRSRSSLSIEIENHVMGNSGPSSDIGAGLGTDISVPHRVQSNPGRIELLQEFCSDVTSGILGATILGTLVKKATNYVFGILFFVRGGLLAIMDWV